MSESVAPYSFQHKSGGNAETANADKWSYVLSDLASNVTLSLLLLILAKQSMYPPCSVKTITLKAHHNFDLANPGGAD